MPNKTITNHNELKSRLTFLLSERNRCEEKIINGVKEAVDTVLHPATIIKQSVHDLASSKDFRADLLKIGVNLASVYLGNKMTDTLVGKLFQRIAPKNDEGRQKGIFGFISKVVDRIKSRPKDIVLPSHK